MWPPRAGHPPATETVAAASHSATAVIGLEIYGSRPLWWLLAPSTSEAADGQLLSRSAPFPGSPPSTPTDSTAEPPTRPLRSPTFKGSDLLVSKVPQASAEAALTIKKLNKKTDRGKETRRGKNHSKRSTLYRSSAAPHRYVLLFTSCTSRGRASRTRHAFRTHAPPSRPATSHTHHYQGLRWINPCPIYPPVIVTSIFFVGSVRALLF